MKRINSAQKGRKKEARNTPKPTLGYVGLWLSQIARECPKSVKELWEMSGKHGAGSMDLAQVRHLVGYLRHEMDD